MIQYAYLCLVSGNCYFSHMQKYMDLLYKADRRNNKDAKQ